MALLGHGPSTFQRWAITAREVDYQMRLRSFLELKNANFRSDRAPPTSYVGWATAPFLRPVLGVETRGTLGTLCGTFVTHDAFLLEALAVAHGRRMDGSSI